MFIIPNKFPIFSNKFFFEINIFEIKSFISKFFVIFNSGIKYYENENHLTNKIFLFILNKKYLIYFYLYSKNV